MDFVAVAIVSAIVLGHPVQQNSRILIGLRWSETKKFENFNS